MDDLPQKVKIGYLDYTIELFEPDIDADGTLSRIGECDRIAGAIKVAAGLTPARSAESFLHELMHAIWDQWCGGEDEEIEERIIAGMAAGLATVFRDNPDLANAITIDLLQGGAAKPSPERAP